MDLTEPTQGRSLASTVLKALDVLECVASAKHPISVAEISAQIGVKRPSAHRLAITLAHRGYLTGGPRGRYSLGTKLLVLTNNLLEYLQLPEFAAPHLESLSEATGETIHLGVLDDTDILYIDKVESSHTVRMHSVIGARHPVHTTALGKAILAFLPEAQRNRLISRIQLVPRTKNSLTDPDTLIDHLERIRAQGFAVDNIENEEGIRCVAAPVLTREGLPIAAVSISVPVHRMPMSRVQELSGPVIATARKISATLEQTTDSSSARDESS
jgi:IclR family transcriptional regulator, KDG regulon repressor